MVPKAEPAVDFAVGKKEMEKLEYRPKILWLNVVFFVMLHISCLYGMYLQATEGSIKTFIFAVIYGYLGGLGITAGYHRLWSHRSYKARWPLRVLLCILASIAGHQDIYTWCRDHRVHHKFTETDADPHNIKRGFFFAHVGWLMCKKHPDVTTKGKSVCLCDIVADPVVRIHRRFYFPIAFLMAVYLPAMIPVWFWKESLWISFSSAVVARYCISVNIAWLVNSAAHYYGDQPLDQHIQARENPTVSFITGGEGWHNYHHVFPWDYAASELGYSKNFTKIFIDLMAFLGLAYDLKSANPESIKSHKLKTGDGTRLKNVSGA